MKDSKFKKLLEIPTASKIVRAKATYYPAFVRVFIPNEPYMKDPEGFEKPVTSGTSLKLTPDELYETDIERSIRRTRKKIKDYVLCNEFDLFVTFTFRDDRYDVARCKTRMAGWLKNQRARTGKFNYLIVSEFHKDKALHFHALLGNYAGKLKPSINPNTGEQLSQGRHLVYELPSYTLGFTNVKKIESDKDSQTKVGFYIQKYITKDMPLFFGKNRYWASKGLVLPVEEDNPQEWYKHVEPTRQYVNDHGTILEFDKTELPKELHS